MELAGIHTVGHWYLWSGGGDPSCRARVELVDELDEVFDTHHITREIENVCAFHAGQQASDERFCNVLDVLKIHESGQADLEWLFESHGLQRNRRVCSKPTVTANAIYSPRPETD